MNVKKSQMEFQNLTYYTYVISIMKYNRTYLQTLDSRLQGDTVRYRTRLIFLEADTPDSYLMNILRKIFYTIA